MDPDLDFVLIRIRTKGPGSETLLSDGVADTDGQRLHGDG